MLLRASSRWCAWFPKRRLRLRWTPHEADHHAFQREKTRARVVLKSREGEGLTCVGRGQEVSDRLDCCRISGQYGAAIQRDLVPVEVSLGLACGRGDIVRAPDLRRGQFVDIDA
jgi:hypothetical protein